MKRIIAIAAVLWTTAACHQVPAGHVGLRVDTMGSGQGSIEKVQVGWHLGGVSDKFFNFPLYEQTANWGPPGTDAPKGTPDRSILFQTKNGMRVKAAVGINYQVDPDKVVELFKRYRRGLKEITNEFLYNEVRSAFIEEGSTVPIESMYGEGKQALLAAAERRVRTNVAHKGIILNKIYAASDIVLPEIVVRRLDKKIEATQRAEQSQRELQMTLAEAAKAEAHAKGEAAQRVARARGKAEAIILEAEAQAKANRIIARSLTPLLVTNRAVEKWDGAESQIRMGKGGVMSLLLDASKLKRTAAVRRPADKQIAAR